jgi:hypothetical protein
MLRVTIHDDPESLTLQFEGKLADPRVQEAQACWRGARTGQRKPILYFDVTGVTLIDAAGKALLAAAHAEGVELVACGCLMRAIVAEIANSPVREHTSTKGPAAI